MTNIFKAAFQFASGIFYCENCFKATIMSKSNDPSAFNKIKSSGMLKPDVRGQCMLCGKKSDYKVELSDAMKAIKRTQV